MHNACTGLLTYQIAPRMHFCHMKTIAQRDNEQMFVLFLKKNLLKTIFAKDRDTDVTPLGFKDVLKKTHTEQVMFRLKARYFCKSL